MSESEVGNEEGLPKVDGIIDLDSKTPEDFLNRPDVKAFANLPKDQLRDFLFTEAKRAEYKNEEKPDAKILLVLRELRTLPSSDPKGTEILDGAIELLKQKLGK